MNYCIKVVHL